jgi:DNA-binding response OmpR family regulator
VSVTLTPASVVRILLVEDNREFANLVQLFLRKHEPEKFEVVWKDNGAAALELLAVDRAFEVILMDYFLPGRNGLEVTKLIQEGGYDLPIIFLTVNKDFDLAVEVMKLGVEDYLVKEEISTPVLPRAILSAIERKKLKDQLTELEISQKRLETLQDLVVKITGELRVPLDSMRANLEELSGGQVGKAHGSYLKIIRDNLERIEKKIAQLKELKSDRTVTYVQDIKMIDLG